MFIGGLAILGGWRGLTGFGWTRAGWVVRRKAIQSLRPAGFTPACGSKEPTHRARSRAMDGAPGSFADGGRLRVVGEALWVGGVSGRDVDH